MAVVLWALTCGLSRLPGSAVAMVARLCSKAPGSTTNAGVCSSETCTGAKRRGASSHGLSTALAPSAPSAPLGPRAPLGPSRPLGSERRRGVVRVEVAGVSRGQGLRWGAGACGGGACVPRAPADTWWCTGCAKWSDRTYVSHLVVVGATLCDRSHDCRCRPGGGGRSSGRCVHRALPPETKARRPGAGRGACAGRGGAGWSGWRSIRPAVRQAG